jgi:NAD(P)-dependent dehydrogenase (short-subunit alcohol dehydrogenase family)
VRTAIVTGGSRGIGLAIVKQLTEDGFHCVIFDMREPDAEEVRLIREKGREPLYIPGDVTLPADRERLIDQTLRVFSAVHVLVNNAGVGPSVRADLLDMAEDSWDRVLGVNTKAAMFLTQAIAKQMIGQAVCGGKRGVIINIGSCSAEVSSVNRGEYCVSKAGMSMLTKLYADRLAREGIWVNEVRPGVIMTEMTGGVKAKYDALIEQGVFPIARWGTPQDVAGAVSALVSDRFLYTTGAVIDVDGGFHIKRL